MNIRFLSLLAVLCLTLAACGESAAGDVATLEDTADNSETEDVATLTDDADVENDESEEEVDAEAAMLEFTQCLREQGIDIDDPTMDSDGNVRPPRPAGGGGGAGGAGGGEGMDRGEMEATQEARDECSELIEGVSFGFGEMDQTALQDQMFEFSTCLREQGLEVDDPDFSEGGVGGRGILGDLDRNDPEVAEALEECNEFLGDAAFGAGGGGPGRNQGDN